MKVGFIGAGRMTQRRYANLPFGWKPVAVYDKPGARVDRYIKTSLERLHVESPEAVCELSDLVIVATPHQHLARYAHMANDAGCQVFIEKPGAVRAEELDGLGCRVGFNHRFWPGIQRAQKVLTGPVRRIRATYGTPNLEGWRLDAANGDELLDQGSHLIDLCRLFMGEVEASAAWLSHDLGHDVADTATVVLNDGRAVLCVSWDERTPVFRFEVITENENVIVEGFPWDMQTVTVNGYAHRAYRHDASLLWELEDMRAYGREGATSQDARRVLEVIGDCRRRLNRP